MSEETAETTEAPEAQAKDEPKGLRATIEKQAAQIKERDAEIAEQRTVIMSDHYATIGLNPEAELGKAIAKEYNGVATLEALAAYAKDEYGYEVPVTDGAPPQLQNITQGHDALDQVGQTAGSVPIAPTEGDTLAEAEAKGDYATTMAIKGQQMADMLNTRR